MNTATSFQHGADRNDRIVSPLKWLAGITSIGEITPESTKAQRKTGIIATIGPKSNNVETLQKLREAGMNIVRLNFSHGSYEYHQTVIDNVRSILKASPGRSLAIALDTKGPEIRTGLMKDDKDINIEAGHQLIVTTDKKYAEACDASHLYVDYENIANVTAVGKFIYVDDGILTLLVTKVVEKEVHVQCLNKGTLSSRKGVNLPNTEVDLPALSVKDKNDLQFGVKNGVDMIFASFIRRAQDVLDIRSALGEEGKNIKIIVKIENQQGVNNFDEILQETDGVMVARGDLGIEIPASQVLLAQKMMIAKCNIAGKPVVCATQMLESMTYNPRPTRAEVSDVGNAVLDGADCVMLSGETAKGSYPIAAVEMMANTCYLAEQTICYPALFNDLRSLAPRPTSTTETIALAAVTASFEQNAGAIIVLTTSGTSAQLISKYRPAVPILCVTRNEQTARQLHISRGVYPFLFTEAPLKDNSLWQVDVDNRLRFALREALKMGLISKGQSIVAIQGWKGGLGHTNTLRIIQVPQSDAELENEIQGL